MALCFATIFPWSISLGADGGGTDATVDVLLKKIVDAAKQIKTYSVKIRHTHRAPDWPAAGRIKGRAPRAVATNRILGETGRRLRIEATQTPSPALKLSESETVVVFDGTWQWREVTSGNKTGVFKLRIDKVSPDPKNQPFNTGLPIIGTGLLTGEDLPGSVVSLVQTYRMSQLPAADDRVAENEYVFVGKLDLEKHVQRRKRMALGIDRATARTTQEILGWGIFRFSKDNLRLLGYALGESKDNIRIEVEIEYQSVNHELPEDTFEYEPPEGVQVGDITDQVAASRHFGQKQDEETGEQ